MPSRALFRPRLSRLSAAPRPHVLSGEEIASGVVRRVVERALGEAERSAAGRLDELVHETIYTEHARLAHADGDRRAEPDRAFLATLRHGLAHADDERRRELVWSIVDRYATEISGHFDPRVYAIATRLLPRGLGVLLHGLAGTGERESFAIDDQILLGGELGALRSLVGRGTVVLAPTHVSNLDSLVLGYAIYRLGLPPFAYAAGLNLFSSAITGFFMRNLGAYTVDRKKSDPLYRETLKEYATTLLERGQHGLVFPGGTRSRSGLVELHLKKGLLGTVPIAFRRALEAGAQRPRVFVVPCAISYPLVLEASSLIEDWLRSEGGPRYVDLSDEFEKPRRWIDFLRGLLQRDLRVHVRFGKPLDPVGHEVDEEGVSHDRRGRPVDPAGYFTAGGRLASDASRDAEYTRIVANRLVDAYRRETVALPTSVLAYAVFDRVRRASGQSDLFRLLRGIGPDAAVAEQDVYTDVARVLGELDERASRREIHVPSELRGADPAALVDQALATFATYHAVPVLERRGDRVHVGDGNLLFYYRNRLAGHGLLGERRWSS